MYLCSVKCVVGRYLNTVSIDIWYSSPSKHEMKPYREH